MYSFNELLEKSIELKASDLHLTVNQPPTLRINGVLVPLGNEKLEQKHTDAFARLVLDNDLYEKFNKIGEMDRYVIGHFRLAFGNRIVKQLNEFVPTFVACGGTELEGIDYLIAHKILRKFEQLNLSFIKNEIDGYIDYMEKLFGKDSMPECVAYLKRLKKTI